MAIDPIQGLIDYVGEVKPFHTKILEVAVAYAHNDDVNITITEDLELDIALFWPAVVGSPDEGPIRVCSAGYGVEYDRATPYIVVDANISPQTISLEGDHTNAFEVGTKFEMREPYTSAAYASPQTENTPRLVIGIVTSITYDITTNTTIIGSTFISEDWIGSPRTTLTGSPAIGSPVVGSPVDNEFWLRPYPDGNASNGDVFIIYEVTATNTLNVVTRPVDAFGSPAIIVGTSSPFTPIWPFPGGSPFPGSPKGFTGSPATYPNFGSPEVSGNTITIKSTTPDIFLYGQEIEIRNASNADINQQYNIQSARDLGGSPNLVELTVLDLVIADTINDGELLFTPDGFSGGDICGDVPPEILQTHWLETLDVNWRFDPVESGGSNVMLDAFQHFILEADSTANTIIVQGDVRYIAQEFGSPVGGSPTSVPATIQHARSAYGSPFWIGSPYVDLNANNGAVTITGEIVYDSSTNTSTLQLNTVSVSTPTGWIIPVLPTPTVVLGPPLGVCAAGSPIFGINTTASSIANPYRTGTRQINGVAGAPDADDLWITDYGADDDHVRFSFSTPFDWSTATQTVADGVVPFHNAAAGGQVDLVFNNDGTRVHWNNADWRIYYSDLSVPYDISTANLTGSPGGDPIPFIEYGVLGGFGLNPGGWCFSPDGTKVLLSDWNNFRLFQLTLSTPWDVTTWAFGSPQATQSIALSSLTGYTGSGFAASLKRNNDGSEYYILDPYASGFGAGDPPSIFVVTPPDPNDLATWTDIACVWTAADATLTDTGFANLAVFDGYGIILASGNSTGKIYFYDKL